MTFNQPSQKAQEVLAGIIRKKRLEQAEQFILSFKLFKTGTPLPVQFQIHKALNKIRKKEKYDFGAQHIYCVLYGILNSKEYKAQLKGDFDRHDLKGEIV